MTHIAPKKKVFLCTDWFAPGYRAGGPIRSLVNLVRALDNDLEFLVYTDSHDLGQPNHYPGVRLNTWIPYLENTQVYYAASRYHAAKRFIFEVLQKKPDVVYLNSMYSIFFSIIPLLLLKIFRRPVRIILAPRGMLNPGAIQFKKWKKRTFLYLFSWVKLHKALTFHGTFPSETENILKIFGKNIQVVYIPNIPLLPLEISPPKPPSWQGYHFLFAGRIHPIKGLLFALQLFREADRSVHFTIVGPIEDKQYWFRCRQVIQALPSYIRVKMLGPVPPDKLLRILSRQHYFILPSASEGFCHSLVEALSSGIPVLTGEQTPWKNLEKAKAGWTLSLNNPELSKSALLKAIHLPPEDYQEWSSNARKVSTSIYCPAMQKKAYQELFNS